MMPETIRPFWRKSRSVSAPRSMTRCDAVNKELVALYWDIGRMIVERQAQGTGWGKAVVERLAADLQCGVPGRRRLLRLQSLADEGFLRSLSRLPKNSHHWCRNRLEP